MLHNRVFTAQGESKESLLVLRANRKLHSVCKKRKKEEKKKENV